VTGFEEYLSFDRFSTGSYHVTSPVELSFTRSAQARRAVCAFG
jgi:hypothetical protein